METAHQRFETELTLAHGLVCDEGNSDLCVLIEQWTAVAGAHERLQAAARTVLAVWDDESCDAGAIVRAMDALRAAIDAPE